MSAYYNELDPLKAEVLREAIRAGAIAPGEVDERSICDVRSDDLRGFTQCHFFAGGGFWSVALRNAGWPDDRPVWTGSCPCPSFSAAGKGAGFADPRHLWPEWFRLIRECRPAVCFGEQVAAAIGHGWLDLVCGDLEAEGYAVAAAVLGAHSVGAPHIRQRLYFCAHTVCDGAGHVAGAGLGTQAAANKGDRSLPRQRLWAGIEGPTGECADSDGRLPGDGDIQRSGELGLLAEDCGAGGDSHSIAIGRERRQDASGPDSKDEAQRREGLRLEGHFGDVREWRGPGWLDPLTARSVAEAGATRGFWADCDWWYGRDEKYRPAGPGVQPLAHGSPARVGRLRMYGDAICVPAAQAFIEATLETLR